MNPSVSTEFTKRRVHKWTDNRTSTAPRGERTNTTRRRNKQSEWERVQQRRATQRTTGVKSKFDHYQTSWKKDFSFQINRLEETNGIPWYVARYRSPFQAMGTIRKLKDRGDEESATAKERARKVDVQANWNVTYLDTIVKQNIFKRHSFKITNLARILKSL